MTERDPPLWMRYYPALADKDQVLKVYREQQTQKKAAAFFGCSEKTFRKALRYHEMYPALGHIPEKVTKIFKK